MKKKLRVGIIFGGKSAEHEVSIQSARNIVEALDKKKYIPVLIAIGKSGKWYLPGGKNVLANKSIQNSSSGGLLTATPENSQKSLSLAQSKKVIELDVVFPILHGPFGEDGTVQGLLKLLDLPFVGPGVLGSAIGMDKEVTKKLLCEAGIRVGKFLVTHNLAEISFARAKKYLGLPIFVKPVNMGSSVGISKVRNEKEFRSAIRLALQYDRKAILEEAIPGREIECSVLGNENPIASIPGEVIVKQDFYSYEAKYLDENGAILQIPAKLSKKLVKEIQKTAIKVFKTLQLEGMARIDFFLNSRGKLFVNEANTIPGFTNISMYPKLWEISGISYSKLLDKLIALAIERHKKEKKLKTSY